MSQLLDENDRKTLNCLGSPVSSKEIQEYKSYLGYYIKNGFIDTITLFSTFKKATKFSYQFKSREKAIIIKLCSNNKTEILKLISNFHQLDSLYTYFFFKSSDTLELIGDLKNLNHLSVLNREPINLPNSIGNLSKLTDLTIISIQKPSILPKSLKNLHNLEKFHVGTKLTKFPEFILNFKKLTKLSLRMNSLTSLPESIGNLQYLKELDLYNNDLSSLPHSIKKLNNLTSLDIGENDFTSIPENIKYLKNLEKIDISYNPFVSLESFKYLFSNPKLTIESDIFNPSAYKLTIGGLNIPKVVKNLWRDKNFKGLMEYYALPITEIAQKYAQNPKSLTDHQLRRLKTEVTEKERSILEISLPKNDPIIKIINEKLKIELANGFGLMR